MSNTNQTSQAKELEPVNQAVFTKSKEEKQALKDAKKAYKKGGYLLK